MTKPKKIYLPWWAMVLICATVGFLLADWAGAAMAGALGYFAWRMR